MTTIHNTTEIARILRAVLMGTAVVIVAVASESLLTTAQSAPIVYPGQGQSTEQQGHDEAECRSWAQQQTGFNPAQGPAYVGSSSGGGEVARGAAGGALVGVVGGAIGGNAGKGAAIGAGVGATGGLLRKNSRKRSDQQAQQQANTQYNQQLDGYNRAFGACMQGRGYTVN